ncbi:HalOD1 output domain-containing protein [Natronorubrum sp. A-ect3]|uniref:HalOD1 output domain-containing protein n=1 Tax=Natronorubrum sp. A-ect3 TaxID=3242698 RepID=UPI00359DB8EB
MVSHVPSYRVVEAIAQKEGVSPTELSPPLFSVVDPEALDALAQPDADSNTGQIEIAFTYLDYVVQVRTGSEISISVQTGDKSTDTPEPSPKQ